MEMQIRQSLVIKTKKKKKTDFQMRNELLTPNRSLTLGSVEKNKKKKSQKCGPFSPFYGPHNFPWRNYPGSYGSSHSAVRSKAHHPVSDQESAFVFPKPWTLNSNVQHVEKANQVQKP